MPPSNTGSGSQNPVTTSKPVTSQTTPTSSVQTTQSVTNPQSSNQNNNQNQGSSTNQNHGTGSNQSQSSNSGSNQGSTNTLSTGNCDKEGFFGNPDDCSKFYRCVDDGNGKFIKYDFACGEGTLWDDDTQACNHPRDIKNQRCSGESAATTGANTSKPSQGAAESQTGSNTYLPPSNTGSGSENPVTTSKPVTSQTTPTSSVQTTQSVTNPQSSNQNNNQNQGSSTNQNHGTGSNQSQSSNSGSNQASTSPLSKGDCDKEGFFGNTDDCSKFYRCVDDGNGKFIKYDFACGEGTLWDDDTQACNHPRDIKNSRCNGKTVEPSRTTVGYPEKITTERQTTLHQSNGGATSTTPRDITESTPVMTTTNPITQTSNQNSNQNQGVTSKPNESFTTISGQSQTTNSQPSNEKCRQEGFYSSPDDCKKFYRCVSNGSGGFTKHEFTCGEGTAWDQDLQTCNYPQDIKNSQCSGSPSGPINVATEQSSTIYETTENQSQTGGATTNEATEVTTGGTTTNILTETTTTEISTSAATELTTQPVIVTTTSAFTDQTPFGSTTSAEVTTTDRQTEPTTIGQTEPAGSKGRCEREGYMGHESSCRKFYRCADNGNGGYDRFEFSCADGTAWDNNQLSCVHENEVQGCLSETTTDSSSQTTTAESTDKTHAQTGYPEATTPSNPWTTDRETTTVGQQTDTTTSIISTTGQQIDSTTNLITTEPSDSTTNIVTTSEHQTDSTTNIVTTSEQQTESTTNIITTTDQQTSRPSSNKNCEAEGFYGDPDDCVKFYRCVDNGNGGFNKHEFNCGDGTAWDQDLQTCNHENVVQNCEGKQGKQNI